MNQNILVCIKCNTKYSLNRQKSPLAELCKKCRLNIYEKRRREKRKGNVKQWATYKKHQDNYRKTLHGIFYYVKRKAKKRKIEWKLSFEEFTTLRNNLCFYCDQSLPKTGVGLDRIDSDKGYLIDNVVPCCARCNIGKNVQNGEEFKLWIKIVYEKLYKFPVV